MRRLHVLGLTAALAVFAFPDSSSAQIAERIRREQIERERAERYNDRYDRYDRGRPSRARGGPPFCRSGRGHPVHGRRWCVDKGFGLGGWSYYDRRYGYDWDRVRWSDVRFRDRDDRGGRYDRRDRDRDRDRNGWDDRRHDGGWLESVIGDVVFGRLTNHSRSLGWNEPLSGEWFDDDRARVLTVFSGERPLAELIDADRDGRADDVRLIRRR